MKKRIRLAVLFLLVFPATLAFVERIHIQLLTPHRKNAANLVENRDPAEQARLDFARAMGQQMEEMRQVRKDLVEMGQRLMERWGKQQRMEPGAMLAEALEMFRARNSDPERVSENRESVALLNRAIGDYMFESDILLDANQSRTMLEGVVADAEEGGAVLLLVDDEGRRRRRRQAQTGRNFPRNQWNPDRPISYFFDRKLGASARKAVRLAAEFWREHTCLSFAENGRSFPRVRVFSGGGCYSQVGRGFRQGEQVVSLGRGCEQFGIAAHELGHTLGFFHGQARADRDQFINVVYSNLSPQMANQFTKQSPEDNNNFGVKYDYGSVMHYSDTDTATSRVTMLARERIYQHTMGNNVAPSFLDVLEMNLYYKCSDRCNRGGANCQNGGYRHPRDCNRCLCPSGFGGSDCSQLGQPENGAPSNCGGIVEAREGSMQELSGQVTATTGESGKLAEKHSICYWHIRVPSGKRLQMRVKSVSGACSDGCFYGGLELKARDLLRVGARVCCRSDVRPLGSLFTSGELAIVSVFSQYKTQGFSLQFRAVNPDKVPSEGVAEYDDLDRQQVLVVRNNGSKNNNGSGNSSLSRREEVREGAGPEKQGQLQCRDVAGNCFSIIHLCENTLYRTLMSRQCAKTCKICSPDEAARGEGAGRGTAAGGGRQGCSKDRRDHESCPSWAKNGFCRSTSYSAQVKKEICPRQCGFC